MDGSFLLDDTALCVLGIGLGMLFVHVDTLDDGAILFGIDLQDLGDLAFVIAGDHLDHIPFLNVQFHFLFFLLLFTILRERERQSS